MIDWQPGHWPQVGIGILVVRDGKVLFGKRKGSHAGGTWAPPGGKQDAGETVEETAARELLEETGMKAVKTEKAKMFADSIYQEEGRHYVTPYVLVTEAEGEPKIMEPEKCEEWRWVDWDTPPQPIFPAVQQILDQGYRPPGT